MKTLAFALAFAGVSLRAVAALQDQPKAQEAPTPAHIQKLVADLGSDNYETRENADRLLRKIGQPATEALKKAQESDDAETRARAKRIVEEIESQEKAREKRKAASSVRMQVVAPEFSLKIGDDGVTLEEKSSGQTYTAESMDEFKKKYPELVKKYNLDAWTFSFGPGHGMPDDFLEGFKDFDFGFDFDRRINDLLPPEFRKQLEDQRKQMEESFKQHRQRMREFWKDFDDPALPNEPEPRTEAKPVKPGAKIGIEVGAVSDTLRAQLGLADDEGVIVEGIGEGTPAAKAGLAKHDVIVAVNGQKVGNHWTLRRVVSEALGAKGEVDLTIVRKAKRETVKVKAP